MSDGTEGIEADGVHASAQPDPGIHASANDPPDMVDVEVQISPDPVEHHPLEDWVDDRHLDRMEVRERDRLRHERADTLDAGLRYRREQDRMAAAAASLDGAAAAMADDWTAEDWGVVKDQLIGEIDELEKGLVPGLTADEATARVAELRQKHDAVTGVIDRLAPPPDWDAPPREKTAEEIRRELRDEMPIIPVDTSATPALRLSPLAWVLFGIAALFGAWLLSGVVFGKDDDEPTDARDQAATTAVPSGSALPASVAPSFGALQVTFDQASYTTTYALEVRDADDDVLEIEWTLEAHEDCGVFVGDGATASWQHPHESQRNEPSLADFPADRFCEDTTQQTGGHPGEVIAVVDDGTWRCTARYEGGSEAGTDAEPLDAPCTQA